MNINTGGILRDAGKRITPQRVLVLEAIREGGEHLDAAEIYRRAREKLDSLSLSTVYRTISVLKDVGVIEEVRLGEGHSHYEMNEGGDHHHMICLGCGKIVEFDCPFSEGFRTCLGEQHDFEITAIRLSLQGYCSECRAGRSD